MTANLVFVFNLIIAAVIVFYEKKKKKKKKTRVKNYSTLKIRLGL